MLAKNKTKQNTLICMTQNTISKKKKGKGLPW